MCEVEWIVGARALQVIDSSVGESLRSQRGWPP